MLLPNDLAFVSEGTVGQTSLLAWRCVTYQRLGSTSDSSATVLENGYPSRFRMDTVQAKPISEQYLGLVSLRRTASASPEVHRRIVMDGAFHAAR